MAVTRKRKKPAAATKTAVKRRRRPQKRTQTVTSVTRRTTMGRRGRKTDIMAIIQPGLMATAGGAAGFFLASRIPAIGQNPMIGNLIKIGAGVGVMHLLTRQGQVALGAGIAGGMAAQVLPSMFPGLAEGSLAEYTMADEMGNYEFVETSPEDELFLDDAGQPMYLDGEVFRYLEDNSLADENYLARYNAGEYF